MIKVSYETQKLSIEMPKIFTSRNQKIGKLGENIVVKFLMKHGFSILERNYTKPWGEIDVIAKKNGCIHFIEVKSVSRKYFSKDPNYYNPADNMHVWKRKRLARTIQTYILSKKINEKIELKIDLFIIYLDIKNKKAKIEVVKDIIL